MRPLILVVRCIIICILRIKLFESRKKGWKYDTGNIHYDRGYYFNWLGDYDFIEMNTAGWRGVLPGGCCVSVTTDAVLA